MKGSPFQKLILDWSCRSYHESGHVGAHRVFRVFSHCRLLSRVHERRVGDRFVVADSRELDSQKVDALFRGTCTFTGWSFIGNNLSKIIPIKVFVKQHHNNKASLIGNNVLF